MGLKSQLPAREELRIETSRSIRTRSSSRMTRRESKRLKRLKLRSKRRKARRLRRRRLRSKSQVTMTNLIMRRKEASGLRLRTCINTSAAETQ